MGVGYSASTHVTRDAHESQVLNLRTRFERRKREINETWTTRYDTLRDEYEMFKRGAGVAAVGCGIVVFALVRSRRSGFRALQEVEKLRTDATLIKHRAEQDVAQIKTRGLKSIARELVAVADNLERASASCAQPGASAATVGEGLGLVDSEMRQVLSNHGIHKLAPGEGDQFDPNFHEAVAQMPLPPGQEHVDKAGAIGTCFENGWSLNDLVLRPARVGVFEKSAAKKDET